MTPRKKKKLINLLPGGTGRFPSNFEGLLRVLIPFCRQIFPLYVDTERLPSKDSALARIRQKRAEYNAPRESIVEPSTV